MQRPTRCCGIVRPTSCSEVDTVCSVDPFEGYIGKYVELREGTRRIVGHEILGPHLFFVAECPATQEQMYVQLADVLEHVQDATDQPAA
jgi:hypothetical protein